MQIAIPLSELVDGRDNPEMPNGADEGEDVATAEGLFNNNVDGSFASSVWKLRLLEICEVLTASVFMVACDCGFLGDRIRGTVGLLLPLPAF